MDRSALKLQAELLEAAIAANRGKSKDVEYVAKSRALNELLAQAKVGGISTPIPDGIGYGLRYFHLDSDLRGFPDISDHLMIFDLLLRGKELPDM